MIRQVGLLIGSAIALSSCKQITEVAEDGCNSQTSKELIGEIFRDAVIQAALKIENRPPSLSESKIRAATTDIGVRLESVRTDKEDPNSTKKFCKGDLQVDLPMEMQNSFDEIRSSEGLSSLSDAASMLGIERNADGLIAEVSYNVQPTDDGEEVFGELEDGRPVIKLAAEVVQYHLLHPTYVEAKAEAARMEAEAVSELEAAEKEADNARIEYARTAYESSVSRHNSVWETLPKNVQDEIRPLQRAWIRRHEATCKLDATEIDGDAADREVARLECLSKAQDQRAAELRQLSRRYL